MLWTAGVNTGRLTKEEFVAVTSANSARILNVYPRKGAVAVGSDADLVICDPEATKTISAKTQVSRIDYNVFEGFACRGLPRATLSRGKVAWLDGDLRAEPGAGDYVPAPALPCRPRGERDMARTHGAAARGARRRDALTAAAAARTEWRTSRSTPSASGTR